MAFGRRCGDQSSWLGFFWSKCTLNSICMDVLVRVPGPCLQRNTGCGKKAGIFPMWLEHPASSGMGWWGGSRRTGVHSHVELGQLWLWVQPKVPWGWWCLPTPAPSPLARSPVPRNINQRGINRWLHEKYIMISQIDPKCLLCKRQQAAQVFPAAAVSHLICVSVPLSLDMGKVIFPWFSFRNLL